MFRVGVWQSKIVSRFEGEENQEAELDREVTQYNEVMERLGYRWTMVSAVKAMVGVIFLFFLAVNVQMLLAAEILAGIRDIPCCMSCYSDGITYIDPAGRWETCD